MATVTGTLRTIGLGSLVNLSPVIEFHPSANAAGGVGTIYSTKPETVTVTDPSGDFEVRLRGTTTVRVPADFHYKLRIRYLDPAFYGPDAGMTVIEFPDWKIYVPEEGGNLPEFIEDAGGGSPFILWTGATAPLARTPNTWWFNPTDSWLKKWSA